MARQRSSNRPAFRPAAIAALRPASRRLFLVLLAARAALPVYAAQPGQASERELARLRLEPPPLYTALLAVMVDEVRNPAGSPVVLHLTLSGDVGGSEIFALVDLGQVALYPSDQPATFLVRIPRDWLLAARKKAVRPLLLVHLSAQTDTSVSDIRAEFRARWEPEPK